MDLDPADRDLVPVTLLFVAGWTQQVVMGRPFGDDPAPDPALTLIAIFIVVLTIAIQRPALL